MKRVLIAIPVFILFIIIAVFTWLLVFFDANNYRDQVSAVFKEATGRELTIAGDLKTSFFPWIGITTGAIEIANAPGFGDAPFASIKGSDIHLRLVPLFSGQIEMETIVLDGVTADLVTLKDGKSNWDFSLPDESGAAQGGSTPSGKGKQTQEKQAPTGEAGKADPSSGDSSKMDLAALAIGGVELRNSNITWDDRRGGTKVDLTNMNLVTGAVSFDTPISVTFNTGFAMNGDEMKGTLVVKTDATLNESMEKVNLKGLDIEIDATGTTLENGQLKTSIKSDIDVDRAAEIINTDKLALTLNLTGKAAPVNPMDVTLESPMKINLASKVIDLPAMNYSVPGSQGSGSLNLSNLDNPMPTVKLALDTDSFDLRPWMAGNTAAARNDATFTEQLLFTLVSIQAAYAEQAQTEGGIPVDTIRKLDVDAGLTVAKLILEGLEATDVKADLKAGKGIVRIEPISAKAFGGTSQGVIELDARADTPKFRLKESMEGVQVGQVMKYSMGKDSKDWISGVAIMEADLHTSGHEAKAITRGLNGNVHAKVKDGALEGFSVRKMLQRANALLKKTQYVDDGSPNRTRILELGTTTQLVNGVAQTDNIKILTPLAEVSGDGQADLNNQTMDFRLKLALAAGLSEIDKEEFKKLEGKTLPLKITGNFSDPRFNLDLDKAAKEEVKQKIEKKLEKKYGDKYKKQLDMLFGR